MAKRVEPDEDGLPLQEHSTYQCRWFGLRGVKLRIVPEPLDRYHSERLASSVAGRGLSDAEGIGKEMEEDLGKMKASKRKYYPNERHRAAIVQVHCPNYHDDLMREMGMHRKVRGLRSFLNHWLQPQWPKNWNSIVEEAHSMRI
uniref:Uncharacterized protein n=1 Tax=Rhodosorus marinus TaxID=101924 RepID=A0A7S0BU91_9RHOD|mmetsp:Transcript_9604/g.14006  ORF Transcript_9604/g.14006 Transcript_9604/m.14006 type:complete len:144 (+) Transcript_9604:352-783(+)